MLTSAGALRHCFPWQTGGDTEQTGGKTGGGRGGERQGETKWVDGDDRNNETEQDRMKGEEKDEMWKNGRMMFSLGFRNLRRSSRGADQRKIMIGDGRRDVEWAREEGGRGHK